MTGMGDKCHTREYHVTCTGPHSFFIRPLDTPAYCLLEWLRTETIQLFFEGQKFCLQRAQVGQGTSVQQSGDLGHTHSLLQWYGL